MPSRLDDALKGASRVLRELRKIVVEIHGDNLPAVLSILGEYGFGITTIPYELNVYVIGTRPAASAERCLELQPCQAGTR